MKVIGKTRTNQPVEKEAGFDEEVNALAKEVIEDAESAGGFVDDVLGLDAGGHFVKFPATKANPTLAGTESALTGIEIQGTKYHVGKPIYYHPIYLSGGNSDTGMSIFLTCAILDNNPTPYTFDTWKAKVKSLMNAGALIQCNGLAKKTGPSNYYPIWLMLLIGADYKIDMSLPTGLDTLNLDDIQGNVFQDGVNKIN